MDPNLTKEKLLLFLTSEKKSWLDRISSEIFVSKQWTYNKETKETINELTTNSLNTICDKIIQQINLLTKSTKVNFQAYEVYKCAKCNIQISGVRYTCTICPNYYLCNYCEVKDNHHHDLLKKKESKFSYQILFCEKCLKPIKNTEIINMCEECPNETLCGNCQEYKILNHRDSRLNHKMSKSRVRKYKKVSFRNPIVSIRQFDKEAPINHCLIFGK